MRRLRRQEVGIALSVYTNHGIVTVHRVLLRPNGWMMLSTHGTWLYHPHPEDHRRWTREGLIGDITAHGFTVEQCIPIIGPLAWTTLVRLTCACYALRKVPLVGKPIGAILALVMNLRAKIEEAITPAWVTNDNACVYLVLARPAAGMPA